MEALQDFTHTFPLDIKCRPTNPELWPYQAEIAEKLAKLANACEQMYSIDHYSRWKPSTVKRRRLSTKTQQDRRQPSTPPANLRNPIPELQGRSRPARGMLSPRGPHTPLAQMVCQCSPWLQDAHYVVNSDSDDDEKYFTDLVFSCEEDD